jgi:hypothetical protein
MARIHQSISLILLIIVFSCEKEQKVTCLQNDYYDYLNKYPDSLMCTDSLCNKYQAIWKELFMEKNNISDLYFNNHVELWRTQIHDWVKGASFSICYKIKIDWAIAYNCDQFIIKIEKDDKTYPSLPLPRDTYLSKNEIKIVTTNRAFSSDLVNISNNENIKIDTFNDAINYLIKKAEVNTLCSTRIYIDESSGNLFLDAYAQYIDKYNECIHASIDLMTLETKINNGVCFIIDK